MYTHLLKYSSNCVILAIHIENIRRNDTKISWKRKRLLLICSQMCRTSTCTSSSYGSQTAKRPILLYHSSTSTRLPMRTMTHPYGRKMFCIGGRKQMSAAWSWNLSNLKTNFSAFSVRVISDLNVISTCSWVSMCEESRTNSLLKEQRSRRDCSSFINSDRRAYEIKSICYKSGQCYALTW